VISLDIPARITSDNPIVIHFEAAIDNAKLMTCRSRRGTDLPLE
jgi:hypothetical protein